MFNFFPCHIWISNYIFLFKLKFLFFNEEKVEGIPDDIQAGDIGVTSKYKIEKTLNAISEILGSDRFICLARELTKSYESILSGPVNQVIEEQSQSSGKGEFTIVIGPSGYSFE